MDDTVLSGKQYEIEARKERFIEVARSILLEEGYEAVSVARVAEATGFSRGTVYQSFSTKEELVTALGLTCRARLLEFVRRGAAFEGQPRERIVAVGVAIASYFSAYPHDQRILKIIDAETILERVGEEEQRQMREYDVRVFQTVYEIAAEAVKQGDLPLRPGLTAEGLCFAFWVMVDGAFAASFGGAPLEDIGITDPLAEVIRSGHCLLDGCGWRPLSSEWDYEETARRVRRALHGGTALPAQGVAHRA